MTTPAPLKNPAFRDPRLAPLLREAAARVLTSTTVPSPQPSNTWARLRRAQVVTMVVLGGISILGGSGSIPGVVLAALIMGLVTFGLGLLNVPGIVMSIIIGALLIAVIALPRLWRMVAK